MTLNVPAVIIVASPTRTAPVVFGQVRWRAKGTRLASLALAVTHSVPGSWVPPTASSCFSASEIAVSSTSGAANSSTTREPP